MLRSYILHIVNKNRQSVGPYANLVYEALIRRSIEVVHIKNQNIAIGSVLTDIRDI